MVAQGAKIIFATSYGHLDAAKKVAEAHPDVVVVQQGNCSTRVPSNMGTYFGTVYEPVYLAGIAAGAATKTDKLGYVYAFPIPQTLANINAFELGAQSVNPDVETIAVNTPAGATRQAAGGRVSLLAQGVDVITQHQDCTKTIIEATEAAGAFTVGYHADASSLAPEGWLTGSEWDWGPLYTDIVQTVDRRRLHGQRVQRQLPGRLQDRRQPVRRPAFGPGVTDETKAAIAEPQALAGHRGGLALHRPGQDQDGTVVIEDGRRRRTRERAMDYFVQGVVGQPGPVGGSP